MKKIITILVLTSFINNVMAQLPECGADVPFFQVDLTGQPSGTWVSPWHTRLGNCCNTNPPDDCTSFEVTLDSNAAMINFEVAGGAVPQGAMFYQINCGPQIAVGEPICISGVGPHHVTFCKPGNNENTYVITSIPKPIFPLDDTVRIGCTIILEVMGMETTSITWESVYPGTPGQYNGYLSCVTACATPYYTPDALAPAYIDYKICGFPVADECGYVGACDTVRIYNLSTLTGSVTPAIGAFCAGGAGVLLTASATGGDGNYSYIWRDSSGTVVSTSSTHQANVAGTYSVEISDGLSEAVLCLPVLLSIPVIEVQPPSVSAGADQVHCADSPNSVLNSTMINCTGIIWSGGNGNILPSDISPSILYEPTAAEILSGSVQLIITSTGAGGGCPEASDTVNLIFPPDISVDISPTTINCYGDNATFNATVTGGAGTISYLWSTGAITSSINAGAGNYCVRVTDTLGCYFISCDNVTVPTPMNIIMTSLDATLGPDGAAITEVSGGTAPYNYLWNDPLTQTNDTASGLFPGMYTVIATDQNGCTISSSVIVNDMFCSGMQAAATATNVTCFGDTNGEGYASATGGTAPYTFSWQSPLSGTNDTITGLDAGTYLVIVTDANGCSDAATITVIEPLQLINVMNHTDETTSTGNDGTATLNISGGNPSYTYLWDNGATTSAISGLMAGTYFVTITDNKGCMITDSVRINKPACTDFLIGITMEPVSCYNATDGMASVTVLNGVLPYTYSWNSGQTTNVITGISAGMYSATVTDGRGCLTFLSVMVIQPSELSVTLAPTEPTCAESNNATVELAVYGGTYPYSYNWSNGAQSEDLFNVPPGNYSVTVTDLHGCTTVQSTSIGNPDPITDDVSLTNVTCNGGSDGTIDITVTGGTGLLSYLWSNGTTTEDINGLTAGLYSVTVTDQNGCANTVPLEVYINEPNVVASSAIQIECPVPGSGMALVTVFPSGGSGGNYQVSFDNGNTFQAPGDYTIFLPVDSSYYVVISDSNQCVNPISDSIFINPEVIVASAFFNTCFSTGDSLVTVTVDVSGGWNTDYCVSCNNGNTFNSPGDYTEVLPIGNTYQLLAYDTAGCMSVPFTITIPAAFEAIGTNSQYSLNNISCAGGSDGSIDASVSGGTSPYVYSWDNGASTEDISSLTAGTYTLTVTDSFNCVTTASFTLTEPDTLNSIISVSSDYNGYGVSCYGFSDGATDLSVTGGSLPYSFNWSNGALTEDLSSVTSGNYSVLIADNNGCISVAEVTVSQPDSISVSDVLEHVLCNGFANGEIDITVAGGVSPYGYYWSNGASTEDISSLAPGSYSVTVTDDNGCTKIHSATIIELSPISLSAVPQTPMCYNDSNGSITINISGGTQPYQFSWSNGAVTQNINGLSCNMYMVLVTDVNNCTVGDTILLTQPDSLFANATSPILANGHNISYYNGNDGSIDLTVIGGTPPYTYNWSNGSATEDQTGLTAGTYSVIITDVNGCYYTLEIRLDEPDDLNLTQGFSPNNDRLNDNFIVEGIEAYPDNTLTVFNRWGNIVYETENYTNNWDGVYEKTGERLPDGTYFVILLVNSPETITLKGYVELRK